MPEVGVWVEYHVKGDICTKPSIRPALVIQDRGDTLAHLIVFLDGPNDCSDGKLMEWVPDVVKGGEGGQWSYRQYPYHLPGPVHVKKPPLGVMPVNLWKEQRIGELSRAIHDHVFVGNFDERLSAWSRELTTLLEDVTHD